jgi:hypothetical protein
MTRSSELACTEAKGRRNSGAHRRLSRRHGYGDRGRWSRAAPGIPARRGENKDHVVTLEWGCEMLGAGLTKKAEIHGGAVRHAVTPAWEGWR